MPLDEKDKQELAGLSKMRKTIREQMQKMLLYVRDLKPGVEIEQLVVRQKRVKELFNSVSEIEREMFLLDAEQPSEILIFEDSYYEIITGLNKWCRKVSIDGSPDVTIADISANNDRRTQINLPKINIMPFSGDFMEWQSFHDLFMSTIHENAAITPAQKFQYLKGLLKGEAASLIKHFSITEANYNEAFKKLRDRYDRKKHTINAFIRTFLDQPSINSNVAVNIRKLLNTSDEIIRGLRALGTEAESRDPWLIFILLNKVDEESRSLWSHQTSSQDYASIEDFLKFLANRSDALESMKSSSKKLITSTKATESSRVYALNAITCDLCKTSDHLLFQCKQFLEKTTEQRRSYIKQSGRCFNCLAGSHSVYQCRSRKNCHVCKKKHHTLLHIQTDETLKAVVMGPTKNEVGEQLTQSVCAQSNSMPSQSILPTALIRVKDRYGNRIICRVLLDTGSQLSFISEACIQRLNLSRRHGRIAVSGIGQCKIESTRGLVSLNFTGRTNAANEIEVDAYILPKITTILPPSYINSADMQLLENLQLADPERSSSKSVDILLGAETVFNLISSEKIRNSRGQIIAQNTSLGWILVGKQDQSQVNTTSLSTAILDSSIFSDVDKSLRAFWELEELAEPKSKMTLQEETCEKHFNSNTTRDHNGRFVVRLPFKEPKSTFGNSLNMATNRLYTLERKFAKDERFARMYREFIKEYNTLGHMRPIKQDIAFQDNRVFLPHHGVFKNESTTTKLRVVFDASAKTSNMVSLNDTLLVGPSIQSNIFEILLRYREHTYVISADIVKMYRQILVDERDQRNQCVIWRDNPSKPINYFQLQTVTYGMAPASFLATRVIEELAQLNQKKFPKASVALHRDMYVDDLMTGTNSLGEAIQLKDDIISILAEAGMQLRKWSSNSSELLNTIDMEQRASNSKEITDNGMCLKVLGINWSPHKDNFGFTVHLPSSTAVTKRIILPMSSKIFDPLGWLAPSTIRFKILLQLLWLSKFSWDDKLPADLKERWDFMREDMNAANTITIPRWLFVGKKIKTINIHAFCDASEFAYAAAAYLRVSYSDGSCTSRLIAAKTKVAPIKQVSIPRLELCAGVLLTRLVESIKSSSTLAIDSVTAWTDSKIVLDWLSSHPRRWSTFIGNRTSRIIQSISRSNWRHVPTEFNPSDCASRGISIATLQQYRLWWFGPDWLIEDQSHWPKQKDSYDTNEEEKPSNKYTLTVTTNSINCLENIMDRNSSYHRIISIISWINRFLNNARREREKISGHLTKEEISSGEKLVLRHVQSNFFAEEIAAITKNRSVGKHSKILTLAPFVDECGIMRVGGRIGNSVAPFEVKHPMILPQNAKLVKLLIRDVHIQQGHAGLALLSNTLKQRFWITRVKTVVREIIAKCTICSRYKHRVQNQAMAELPECRVNFERPFLKVGVDYAGPFFMYQRRGRGQRPHKAYVALFVCTSVKAVHIELVNDLTTEAFLAALRRFISRRGLPSDIYSDNGSNFVGANRELKEVYSLLDNNSDTIANFLLKERINWHFNPPNAPHFGGLWEAVVKSLKFHLRRMTGKQILTYDELHTVLTQIEAMLNSRPLCKANNDELDVLTPAHFLIGYSANYIPENDVTSHKISLNTRWQFVQQVCQHFWNRWHQEYLITLQNRAKWHTSSGDINIGDIVLIKDERTPPSKWLLSRVHKTFPGPDGKIRVVELLTASGIFKRSIMKLVKLPVDN